MLMVIALVAAAAALSAAVALGLFAGYRLGHREGRRVAELCRQEHWVDLLERAASTHAERSAASGRTSLVRSPGAPLEVPRSGVTRPL